MLPSTNPPDYPSVFHLRLVSLLRRAVPFLLALYFILLFFVDGTLRRTWRFLRPGWPLRRWRRRRHMARGSHGARGPLEQQRMQAEEIEGFRCYTAACCVCPVCIIAHGQRPKRAAGHGAEEGSPNCLTLASRSSDGHHTGPVHPCWMSARCSGN